MEITFSCPRCHSDLKPGNEKTICCISFGKEYPIVRQIPILINEERSVFSIDDYAETIASPNKPSGGLKSMIIRAIWFLQRNSPEITLNVVAKKNYALFGQMLLSKSSNPKVLVIGGRTLGQGMEDLVKLPITFIETDIAFGPLTKIICDAQYLPFKDETFDGVIIQAVMEYMADPFQCAAEIHRVLRSNAILYSETPFMQPVHGGAHDFTRFTHLGHRRLYRNFEEIASGTCLGTGSALTSTYRHFILSLTNKKILQELLSLFAVWTSFFLKYFDLFTINNRVSYDAASGFYFLGKKSSVAITDKEILKGYRGNL